MGKMKEFAIEEQNRIEQEEQMTLTKEEYESAIHADDEEIEILEEDVICSECMEHAQYTSVGTDCCGAEAYSYDYDFDRWED